MNPYSAAEIATELKGVDAIVNEYFAGVPAEVFFAHPPQVWSPGENLVHLGKSVKPIAQALRLPKLLPQVLFGASGGRSRTFGEILKLYKGYLAAGARSPSQFVPELEAPSAGFEATKGEVLARWYKVVEKLETALATWSEEDLDRYQLPHPLLGMLTVREMLFFTLYHNLHHVNDVRVLLGQTPLEV